MSTAIAERQFELAEMARGGDIKTVWNPDSPVEVEIARKAFDDLKAKGFTIYRVNRKGETDKRMDAFDPEAEKMIAVPRVVGG